MFVGGSPKAAQKEWDRVRRGLANQRTRHAKRCASGAAGIPYRPYKHEKALSFLEGFRGTEIMEGNLDVSARVDDIVEEMADEEEDEDENNMEDANNNDKFDTESLDHLPCSQLSGVYAFESPVENKENEKATNFSLASSPLNQSHGPVPTSRAAVNRSILRPICSNSKVSQSVTTPTKHSAFSEQLKSRSSNLVLSSTPVKATVKTKAPSYRNAYCGSSLQSIPEDFEVKKLKLGSRTYSISEVSSQSLLLSPRKKVLKIPETASAMKSRLKKERQEQLEKMREMTVQKVKENVKAAAKAKEEERQKLSKGDIKAPHLAENVSGCGTSSPSDFQKAVLAELGKADDCVVMFLVSMADGLRSLPKKEFRECQISMLNTLFKFEATANNSEQCEPPATEISSSKLTADKLVKVEAALALNADQFVLTAFNITLQGCDIHTLKERGWLNDKIINIYLGMIQDRSMHNSFRSVYAFDTFFLPQLMSNNSAGVRSRFTSDNILHSDLLLVPVFQDKASHWSLIVVDMHAEVISAYDSLCMSNQRYMDKLEDYLIDSMDGKAATWKKIHALDVSCQVNGSDCGVFVCIFAKYIACGKPLIIMRQPATEFRKIITHEILDMQLLD